MSTAVGALPNILDPMYWIGPQGLFAAAVLPTILVIVFVETGLLFPLLPGVSYMRYPVYLAFDIVGGILWGGGVTVAGYFLGNVPFVHQNLEKIILAILFVSLLPALIAAWRGYRARRRSAKATSDTAR